MEALTLTSLLKAAAAAFPDRRAIAVHGKIDLTHAALDALVDAAAARLAAGPDGLRPGQTVALCFPNTVELVVMFLAVIRARGVAAPLNPAYTQEEFEFYLSDSGARLLVTGADGNAPAQAAAAKLALPHAVAATLTDPAGPLALAGLPDTQDDHPAPQNGTVHHENENEPSDVALFLHTSGTTSRPKGVPLTQRNLAASVQNIRGVYRFVETDATVVTLPLFHVHGLMCALLSSLASGASVALPAAGRFSASTFWADMLAAGATWYTAVPTIHQIILDRHTSRPEPRYPALRFVRSCSASLAPVILERLEAAFGAPVLEAYAMTEASHMMTSNPLPQDGPRKPGSVGRAAGAMEVAVLDEAGNKVPADERGEVCIRGANVTGGYKTADPGANAAAFAHGWFHTGDIGVMDGEGYVRLVGRIKELINRGGEKISPIEVDSVLLGHPDVAQAVSFGVPDDKYGEEIHCAVIPRGGAAVALGEEEVVAFCRKNLAAFKVPKKVYIADDLPKTATGKIQRRIVAQHFFVPTAAAAAKA
ncbi:oxalate--CoA ligase [Hordeum vulgare subsp. vulgare]|uniref:4-coumarate--CoA ligase n=1 Tax=Hordeum vulgare subsp. vulgare TaxID=112509 RepID=A0A8I6XIK3_HORVV|nr:oxalate--CoA ligase [Hordeum vulgare subsp. vulgare]